MGDSKIKAFARYKGSESEIYVESWFEGGSGDLAKSLTVTRAKLHDEAIRKALAESGYAIVPINNISKITRSGDQSIQIVFPSCRSASEFERAISNENNNNK